MNNQWKSDVQKMQQDYVNSPEFKADNIPKLLEILNGPRRDLLSFPGARLYHINNYRKIAREVGAYPLEYFAKQLYKYGPQERDKTMPPGIRLKQIYAAINDKKAASVLNRKPIFNTIWAKYIKRPWCESGPNICSPDSFLKKFSGCDRLIIKPLGANCGNGIEIADITSEDDLKKLYQILEQDDAARIVEKYVHQKGLLHEFNPDTLNTMRVLTLRTDTDIKVLSAAVRVGRAGGIVDNLHQDGFAFGIDVHSGCILKGSNKYGMEAETHPDTGIQITGRTVPHWEDICRTCLEAHTLAPANLDLIGWDVCLSGNEISLIEANSQPDFVKPCGTYTDEWDQICSWIERRPETENDNLLLFTGMCVEGNTVKYQYVLRGPWRSFFRLREEFHVKYSFDVKDTPKGILILPFLTTVLPLAWLNDAQVVVPFCDQDFFESVDFMKNEYQKQYPELKFGGSLLVNELEKNNRSTDTVSGKSQYDACVKYCREAEYDKIQLWKVETDRNPEDESTLFHQFLTEMGQKNSSVSIQSSFRKIIRNSNVEQHFRELSGNPDFSWWGTILRSFSTYGHAAVAAWNMNCRSLYMIPQRFSDGILSEKVTAAGTGMKHFLDMIWKNQKKNLFVFLDFRTEGGMVCCDYLVRGSWSEYFTGKDFRISYPINMEETSAEVLMIPFLTTVLPISWLCDAQIWVPCCEKGFLENIDKMREEYAERYPMLSIAGEVITTDSRTSVSEKKSSERTAARETVVQYITQKEQEDRIEWNSDQTYSLESTFAKIVRRKKADILMQGAEVPFWNGLMRIPAIAAHLAPVVRQQNIERIYVVPPKTKDCSFCLSMRFCGVEIIKARGTDLYY